MKIDEKTRNAVDELLSAIEIDDSLIYSLRELGNDSKEYLLSLLANAGTHPRRDLVHNAVYVLGELGFKEGIPALSRLLEFSEESTQMRALHVLGRLDRTAAEAQAFRVLEDSQYSTTVKGHALIVLGGAINPESTGRLRAWVEQNDIQELKSLSEEIIYNQDAYSD